jgi:UDP-glucuronate decarboxylase
MDGQNGTPIRAQKRTLVTGGAGFLGSHLCERLLQEGHRVVALDNLVSGNLKNLDALRERQAFSFVEHDVTEPYEGTFDYIINLACCASPVHYQSDPIKTMRTCTIGALNVLELARRNGARVFQASTSEVYGEPEVHPQKEQYRGSVNSIGPRACYDEGKRCSEALFFDYQRQHGTDIKIARIFNTYGPRMRFDDGRVVSNLVVQALRDEPMTIHGDGLQTRSFCYVDDMIDGFMRLLESRPEFTGPVNLGNPHEVTMLELAERILYLAGSSSKLTWRPMPTDDPTRRCPDITMARHELDWSPKVSLDAGLKRTIDWFKQMLGREGASRTEASRAVA